nr:MAG TPA: hypothetical protein [Caudoviricetes sp.]
MSLLELLSLIADYGAKVEHFSHPCKLIIYHTYFIMRLLTHKVASCRNYLHASLKGCTFAL